MTSPEDIYQSVLRKQRLGLAKTKRMPMVGLHPDYWTSLARHLYGWWGFLAVDSRITAPHFIVEGAPVVTDPAMDEDEYRDIINGMTLRHEDTAWGNPPSEDQP